MHWLTRSSTRARIILVFLCAGLMGADATGGGGASPSTAPSDLQELKELEQHASDAIRMALPAVVAVNLLPRKGPQTDLDSFMSGASGVIISRDGLILSQWHVSHVRTVG